MKGQRILTIFAALGAVSLTLASPAAAGTKKERGRTVRAVPFSNYWDAKNWDRQGGFLFWHRQQDERRPVRKPPAPPRNVEPRPPAETNHISGR